MKQQSNRKATSFKNPSRCSRDMELITRSASSSVGSSFSPSTTASSLLSLGSSPRSVPSFFRKNMRFAVQRSASKSYGYLHFFQHFGHTRVVQVNPRFFCIFNHLGRRIPEIQLRRGSCLLLCRTSSVVAGQRGYYRTCFASSMLFRNSAAFALSPLASYIRMRFSASSSCTKAVEMIRNDKEE